MNRIVFMGTPEFSVPSLRQLAATQNVAGVVTQPDRPAGRGRRNKESPVNILAQELSIPVFQPKSLRNPEAVSILSDWQPDAIVVAAYGQILPKPVLELPVHGCINVHASLLPRWRGAAPIQHAILAGDRESGISLMRMDEGLDTGAVYIRESIDISSQDTAAELHDRLATLGAELLAKYLELILGGQIHPEAQDESKAIYAPQIKKQDGQIDWSQSGESIDRVIRAMTPWPGAYTSWQGLNFKIISTQPYKGKSVPPGKPGSIMKVADSFIVVTGMGAISLDEVQLAGKQKMAVEDFVRGQPEFVGSTFDT
jgi:methionyl-tRNA formyltransferase